jgi:glycerate kinase
MGMLRALGYRFYDKFGGELILGCGANMVRAARIDCRKVSSAFGKCRVSVACDVSAPFYGEDGAARTFARQKGANEVMLDILDRGLVHLATLYFRTTGRDISYMAGSGAAGGLGGALMAFLNAKLKKGGDLILDTIKFNSKLKGAGLIITGEGSIDSQTLMGKAPYAVLQRGLSHDIPVVAVAGKIADQQLLLDAGFSDIYAITPQGLSREEMMNPKRAIANLRATARVIVEKYRKHLEEA